MTFKMNAQFAVSSKPGMCALDDLAMPAKSLSIFYTSASDTSRDSALLQVALIPGKVIALVRMQFARAFARTAIQARHCRAGIDRPLERYRVVPAGPCDRDGKRNAPRVYDDVLFRLEPTPVCRVGAGLFAPRGLETRLAASSPARSQSTSSCSRGRRNIARCDRLHTFAACQSRSPRQHVMPLPKPSVCGGSSRGMRVCKTYRMPFDAERSQTVRRRPPLDCGENTGFSASSTIHNSCLICRLAMPPGYGAHG
jgi:hypothetical protein